MDDVRARFGARVRARRTEIGISQRELGRRCGLHWSYISAIERGERNPALLNILKLAQALDVDAGRLLPPADAAAP